MLEFFTDSTETLIVTVTILLVVFLAGSWFDIKRAERKAREEYEQDEKARKDLQDGPR